MNSLHPDGRPRRRRVHEATLGVPKSEPNVRNRGCNPSRSRESRPLTAFGTQSEVDRRRSARPGSEPCSSRRSFSAASSPAAADSFEVPDSPWTNNDVEVALRRRARHHRTGRARLCRTGPRVDLPIAASRITSATRLSAREWSGTSSMSSRSRAAIRTSCSWRNLRAGPCGSSCPRRSACDRGARP